MLRVVLLYVSLLMVADKGVTKTVILGFDGMDPKLVQEWMDSGDLPHFKKMTENGHFQSLATTNPAQSPVAWSSFATGLNPGKHGIFDFIHRDPDKLEPVYSISGFKPVETIDVLGWKVPVAEPVIYNKRLGKPFWLSAEQTGNKSSVIRVPVTYPPDNVNSMLSGMGVPDLLGTQGTYTFFATKFIDKNTVGGNVIRVKVKNNRIETKLDGPSNPFGGEPLSVPLILNKVNQDSLTVDLDGEVVELKTHIWGQWVPVKFSYGGFFSLNGMVRMYLVESFPRVKLYVSPINISPQSPVLPIANPPEFSKQLSDQIGLYHTLGMPEETWSLNDGLISSEAYLQMVKTVLSEREKMFFKQLDNKSINLLVEVFVQTDRVSHMFWRGYDSQHPEYDNTTEIERNAIKWIYKEADRILGKTLSKLRVDDKLIVVSDHGFAPYYRHVHLNRWLLEEGYLTLRDGVNTEEFTLMDINWQKTRAYAMGLNGIYLNVQGREKFGTLQKSELAQFSNELIAKLNVLYDTEKQQSVINHIYKRDDIYQGEEAAHSPDLVIGYKHGYRASWQTVLGEAPSELFNTNTDKWSGDHCIDPQLVPGVLLTNFALDQSDLNQTAVTNIVNVGSLALSTLSPQQVINNSNVGALDWSRSLLMLILEPLNEYLPVILAVILTGGGLSLWLIMIIAICYKIPEKLFLRPILRFVLIAMSIITFLHSAKILYSKDHITVADDVIVKAIAIDAVELPSLTWQGVNDKEQNIDIQTIGKNTWRYHLTDKNIELLEADGYKLLNLSKVLPIYSRVQKRWWHSVFSSKGGYISPFSQVEKITVESVNALSLWWLWMFAGMLLPTFVIKIFRHKR